MILHLDLDCFFAAAHRINNPHLDNIPIAVGGRSNLSIFKRKKETRHLSTIEEKVHLPVQYLAAMVIKHSKSIS